MDRRVSGGRKTDLRHASGCFHGHDRELSIAPMVIFGSRVPLPVPGVVASMGCWVL